MAVAIVKQDGDGNDMVVGHMPRTLTPTVFYFLSRSFNSGTMKIIGQPLNRGAGMGMKVPCIYHRNVCSTVIHHKGRKNHYMVS